MISLPPNVAAGDTSNGTPLQVTVLNTPISGVGLTVTTTVNAAPSPQPRIVGITVYVAVCTLLVLFNKLPYMPSWPDLDSPPVIVAVTCGSDHLYFVPNGTIPLVLFTGVILKNTPLQVTVDICVITGLGLSITSRLKAAPIQVPDVTLTE
jgi:hypothetical protein